MAVMNFALYVDYLIVACKFKKFNLNLHLSI
jgi:hypothetical protein